MKDFLGKELAVGDEVVVHIGGRYTDLRKGVVCGFTPCYVKYITTAGRTKSATPGHVVKVAHS